MKRFSTPSDGISEREKRERRRIVSRTGIGPRVTVLGLPHDTLRGDVYHTFTQLPWTTLVGLAVIGYLTLNVGFACLYLLGGPCVSNMKPGSFVDAFAFSVQTLATIGYGVMAPVVLDSLGIPSSWVGIYAPLAYGCAILGSLASGTLLTYVGPWRLSFGCLVVAAVGLAVFASATPIGLALGAMIIGISYGPVTAAGSSILAQAPLQNLGLRMAIRQSGVPLGSSLAGFSVPALIEAFGWPAACFLFQ